MSMLMLASRITQRSFNNQFTKCLTVPQKKVSTVRHFVNWLLIYGRFGVDVITSSVVPPTSSDFPYYTSSEPQNHWWCATFWSVYYCPRCRSGWGILWESSGKHPMDFDTFDTDIWSEIQDAPGEIFDIPEMSDERFNVEEHINGNTEFWCLSYQPSPILKWTLTWKCWLLVNN